MNYGAIKSLAKEKGCKVTDLIALAPQNDPFYVGTPSDIKNGEWFAELWQRFGFGYGVHIRRVHYRIISQEKPILMPDGNSYENTENCWNFLSLASKMARYLDLVDPDAFVDRRNPEPHIFLSTATDGLAIDVDSDSWGAADFPEFPPLPEYRLQGFVDKQRYHIEVWCEKSTANDVLIPFCQRYGANLVTGVGEMSVTSVKSLIHRMGLQPVRIFYVSDFDPAGQSMPCAVARKIEFYLQNNGSDADVKLLPVVLSAEQVRQYRLPRTPIKESEKRGARFEDRHGAGAVELDALEALYPGELRKILAGEVSRYFDNTLNEQVWLAEQATRAALDEIQQSVIERYEPELDSLHDEYDAIKADFSQRMADYGRKVGRLWRAISADLEAEKPDLDEDSLPKAKLATEVDNALYDTRRDYFGQLAVYKEWQGKTAVES